MDTKSYSANFDKCLQYITENAEDFRTKYDIVWLCTGSIKNLELELRRHCEIASALRKVGYKEGIYVSQVVPEALKHDRAQRREYMQELRRAGVSRFNSGIEIVRSDYRKKYIHGFKGSFEFEDYVNIFEDAVNVWGRHNAGSCLLAGIEPSDATLHGLSKIAELGVVPSPTVFTPFVVKQMQIPFQYDLDELIDTHLAFTEIISRNSLPVFSGVFSLA
jgi:biotin synthase-related radical SAM superfamily protein